MAEQSNKQDTSKTPAAPAKSTWEELGDTYFVKKAPFQLPSDGKEALVSFLPWVTLVAGVFMLLSAWALYNTYNVYIGIYAPTHPTLGLFGWLAIAALLATSVIYLMAFTGLRDRKKSGWKLLVYAEVGYVAYGLVWLFGYGGLGSLISSLVAALIALYLLFQVRSYYKAS